MLAVMRYRQPDGTCASNSEPECSSSFPTVAVVAASAAGVVLLVVAFAVRMRAGGRKKALHELESPKKRATAPQQELVTV